jgi:hypothetical protein
MKAQKVWISAIVLAMLAAPGAAIGQPYPVGTAFTYQGRLLDGGVPAEGDYDFEFTLYDDPAAGSVVASPISKDDEPVDYGLFTVVLDFGGGVFNGDARWLQVAVRPGSSGPGDPYTLLSPRQPLTAAPYALYALDGPGSGGYWTLNGNDIYYNAGNVGIRTTGPVYPLEVHNNGTTGQILRLVSDQTLGYIQFREGSTTRAYLGYGDAGGLLTNAIADSFAIDGMSTALHFAVDSDATRGITIDTNGNVGIGLTTPSTPLHVSGGVDSALAVFINDNNASGDTGCIYAVGDAYGTGTGEGFAAYFSGVGGSTSGSAYGITTYAQAQGSSTAYGIYSAASTSGIGYAFYGVGDGYFSGNVGIGTSTPTYRLELPNIASTAGRGRANSWVTYSSREEKEDIAALRAEDYAGVLKEIMEMDLVYYRYKNQEDDRRYLGVVAEEAPEQVVTPDRKGLSLSEFAAFAMAGLKAQQAEIEAQQALIEEKDCQIVDVQIQVKETQARLAELEALMARLSDPKDGGAR